MTLEEPPGYDAAEAREIARQAEVELKILLVIEQSLRIALQWMTRDRGNSHKLSTLRFHISTFERHLSRLRFLADFGGYLHLITDANPHLATEVDALRSERAELHTGIEEIMIRLECITPDESDAFGQTCADLERLLDSLRLHGQREAELHQHSFTQEEGGSG